MSDGSFSTKYPKLYQYREIYYPIQIVKEGDCSILDYWQLLVQEVDGYAGTLSITQKANNFKPR
jgi:hypothetical protein